MLDEIRSGLEFILGVGDTPIAWWQMAVRVVLVYGTGLLLVRLGNRRFMGQYTALDMILGVTVGALLSASAGDSDAFVNALIIVFGLGALHWLFTFISYKWKPIEDVLKGKEYDLVEDGELVADGMRKSRMSRSDLAQALRKAGLKDRDQVEQATFERSGEISIRTRSSNSGSEKEDKSASNSKAQETGAAGPQVIEVAVQEGVQRVVIEWRTPV